MQFWNFGLVLLSPSERPSEKAFIFMATNNGQQTMPPEQKSSRRHAKSMGKSGGRCRQQPVTFKATPLQPLMGCKWDGKRVQHNLRHGQGIPHHIWAPWQPLNRCLCTATTNTTPCNTAPCPVTPPSPMAHHDQSRAAVSAHYLT